MTNPENTSKNSKHTRLLYPYVITAAVLMLCLFVWPFGLFGHTTHKHTTLDRGLSANLALSDGSLMIGEFTPSYPQLQSLSFQFLTRGQALDGQITLDICDSFGEVAASVTIPSGDAMNYRQTSFPLNIRLDTKETYTFRLSASAYPADSLFLYTASDSVSPTESGSFYVNGSPLGNVFPAVSYQYQGKAAREQAPAYYAIILLSGALLFAVCQKFDPHEEITDEQDTCL